MAFKRKLDLDTVDVAPIITKHLKLVPFPNYTPDLDVDMYDAELPESFHTRYLSDASSTASSSPLTTTSPLYPTFDLYPQTLLTSTGTVVPNSYHDTHYAAQNSSPNVGLFQPSGSFSHHGTGCSQIPKLRIACSPGANGQRSMWSHCEQCGAISMVETE